MPRLVPIILRLDDNQPNQRLDALEGRIKGLDALNARAMRQFSQGGTDKIDTRQMQDFVRLSKESTRINEINARAQARLATETARQVTQAKQSELRQFENVEKSKQRISEISARGQMKQAELAARSAESQKRREFQEFQRIEREKARSAAAQSGRYGAGDIAGIASTAIGASTVVAGVYAVIKAGVEYQQSMNLFQAVTSATAQQMEKAAAIAVQLGNDVSLPGKSAKDAAEAMTELGKAGMNADQAMAAAKGTLLLSIAANIDAAQAAEITANSLNMFGLAATESTRVADLLAAAASASSAEITDVSASLQQSGAVFNNAKVPIETVVALIAEMANAGIKGSDAGTSLKTMMQRLQSPTNDAAAAMKDLNVDIYDQAGAMRPMRDIIAQFEKGLQGLSQEQKDQALNTIFGADAVRGATIIFGQGAEGLDRMSAAVQRHNAAAELAAARSKGLGGAWENLKSQAETLGLTIFGAIAPSLTAVVLAFASFIGIIGQYPATFAAAAIAVGLLVVALNASTIASFSLGVSQLIPSIVLLGKVMMGTASLIQGAMATTIAATAGWAALILVVAGVAYAFYNMESALDKANALTSESIQTNAQSLQMYRSLAVEAQNLTAASNQTSQAQTQNSDVHDRLNAILGRLDPATQIYIKSLTDEKNQIAEVTDIIQTHIEVQQDLLKSKLDVAAAGVIQAQQEITSTNNEIIARRSRIKLIEDEIAREREIQSTVEKSDPIWKMNQATIEANRNNLRMFGEANIEAEATLTKLNQSFVENNIKVIQSAQGLGYNTEQLREYFINAGYTSQQVDILTAAAQKSTSAQNNLGGQMDSTAGKTRNLTAEVFNLRAALNSLTSASQQNIDSRMFNVINSAVDKNDLVQKAKQAKEDLKNDFEVIKKYKDFEKEYNKIVNPAEKTGGGGGGGVSRIKKDAVEAKTAVRDLKTELGDLSAVLDAMRKSTMAQESSGKTNAKNPLSGATGAFQVMEGNIPGWTKKWLGKSMSVQAFQKDIEAQIGVFNGQMGDYLKTALRRAGGDIKKAIRMAAAAWYGRGELSMGKYDDAKPQMYKGKEYPSFREYTTKVLNRTLQGGSGKSIEVANFTEEMRNAERIVELRMQIASLQKNGLQDEKLKQQIELAGVELEARELTEILKLREKLSFETTSPLPETAEDRKDTLRVLQEFDRRKDQINSTIRNIAETMSGIGEETVFAFVEATNPEEAKQQADQWNLVQKSLEGFVQTGDQARAEIAELSAEFDEGLTPIQKFDLQVRQLKDSGKLTADQLDLLSPVVHKTRDALEKAAAAQWAKKLRADAKSVAEGFSNLADTLQGEFLNLTSEKNPLTDFLRSVEGIKELKIGAGSLDALKGLFTVGNQIDVEKFAKYIRYWLVLRSVVGDFDASKIDEVITKLKEAAESYNGVSEATNTVNFNTLKDGLSGQLEELQRNGRELTEYEKTLRSIEKDYKNLDPAQKQYLLNLAAEIDAQRQFQKSYDEVYGVVRDSLQTLLDDGWGGFFKSILDRFKSMLLDMAAELITSKLMKMLNPSAGGSSSGGGFNIGNILGSIFGGGGGIFNRGSSASSSSGTNGATGGTANAVGSMVSSSGGGAGGGMWGGWLSQLNPRNFTGSGGGSVGNLGGHGSAPGPSGGGGFGLSGGIAAAGMAANIVGGMIGGRVGNVLSMAGTGMSIGMMFGGPWGAAIGAVAGGIAGLLMGDPKRKIDKKENMPKLREGFAKTFEELRLLASDKNAILNDPTGASTRADELRAQIQSGFGIDFQSKKYRNMAKAQIEQRLVEADLIIKGIKEFAAEAGAANIRQSKLTPEFAGGVFMDAGFMRQYSDFKRRNGMLAGTFTGKDTLPSMLAPGEMVLNPAQQARAIAAAGFDIFRYSQIPNYAEGTYVAPSRPSSPSIGTPGTQAVNITFAPTIEIVVEGEIDEARITSVSVKAQDSEEGRRVTLKNVRILKKDREIT